MYSNTRNLHTRINFTFSNTLKAMSMEPVACLLIVVEAHRRMNNVFEEIVKYAKQFQPREFNNIVTACVTHMDEVTWSEQDFR